MLDLDVDRQVLLSRELWRGEGQVNVWGRVFQATSFMRQAEHILHKVELLLERN
jgi:hypothetical protein